MRIGARSDFCSIGSAFITGRRKRVRTVATRSGVSLPCNCSMSGFSASTTRSSSPMVASTDSATFWARPFTRSPKARAASTPRSRGDGGKNTKPTMSAPASRAASSVSGVFKPQILTKTGMLGGVLARLRPTIQPADGRLFEPVPHQGGRRQILQRKAGGLEQRDLVLPLTALGLAAAQLEQVALDVLQSEDFFLQRDRDVARALRRGRPAVDVDPGALDCSIVGLARLQRERADQIDMGAFPEP